MTVRLRPDQRTAAAWRALWEIVDGRLLNDSFKCSQAAMVLMPYASEHPASVLVVAVDAVTDTLAAWGDDLGKNPACLAETAFSMLHGQLQPSERLLLLAAEQTLMAQDPTGEAGRPHPVCRPWPAQTPVVSLAAAGGGQVLQQAIEAASQTHGLAEQPVIGIINAAPGVLTNVLWGLSRSNPDRMRELLDARTV
ncbi:hypothetical protein [Actinoplanes sp. NPDC020271]|uniref:hypothetical protein n=1 Tax=Actinoplanes sp. NPDC020271 TaxID=3363896 RepID=UPI0037BD5DAE